MIYLKVIFYLFFLELGYSKGINTQIALYYKRNKKFSYNFQKSSQGHHNHAFLKTQPLHPSARASKNKQLHQSNPHSRAG
jgi:hypothetical protein